MYRNKLQALAVLGSTFAAVGCASLAEENATYSTSGQSGGEMASSTELAASQQRISELEGELAARERELERARDGSTTTSMGFSAGTNGASLFPPNPKPGECYARVLIPAEYSSTTERVLVREASERFEIVPARYENEEETVVVKEASTRLEVVPAVYEEVQERVLVKPATKKIVEVPAVYDTVTEQVVDVPAHTAWKRGPAATQVSAVLSERTTDTGEIMCLVEVPATYKTIKKTVLVSPARTEEVATPAEYKTVTKTVVSKPATTREVAVPAEYGSVTVTKLVSPAQERRIAIPEEYDTVTQRKKISEEGMEWRQVVCEVNMTRGNIFALQRALATKGYYKAGIDGVIGGQTLTAARSYALANNLPAGSNYVPMEVVESLDLNF